MTAVFELDGYSDLERIGHGGLGDVYRATRDSTGGTVAIKVLRDVSDESVAWHRTRRELTALVSLAGHAHVIQLLELLDLPEGPVLVMEYAPGGSVADYLARRDSSLTVPEAVLIGRHTADALVAAHEQDIVHRDLKPQNLLIDAYGRIKLCDFGIASLARSEDFHTRTNALSLRYASPEDLDEDAEVGPTSDVYSLGATLLHLVHGAPLTMKDRLRPWTPPSTDDAEQAALDAVIADCLQPDPDDRPDTADVLDRLEAMDWTLADRCRGLPVEAPTATAATTDDLSGDHAGDESDAADRSDVSPAAGLGSGAVVGAGAVVAAGPDDAVPDPFGTDERPAVGAPDAFGAEPPMGDAVDDTSSLTARRSDAIPPRPAPLRPPAEPTRRRWPWIVGAIALAAVVGVVLAIVWPAADEVVAPVTTDDSALDDTTQGDNAIDEPADASGTGDVQAAAADVEIVERPDGLDPIDGPAMIWPFGEVGECLVQVNGLDELMPIDCGEPHDFQRFAVADLSDLDPTEFGDDAVFSADAIRVTTDDACRERFVEFVGVASAESEFRIAITRPSADSWGDGDRRFQCLLGVPDHRIIGDAETNET